MALDEFGLRARGVQPADPHAYVIHGARVLALHAQGPSLTAAPLGGDPRPVKFNGRFPVRGDRIEAP